MNGEADAPMTLRNELAGIRKQLEADLPAKLTKELDAIRSQLDNAQAQHENSMSKFREEVKAIIMNIHDAEDLVPPRQLITEFNTVVEEQSKTTRTVTFNDDNDGKKDETLNPTNGSTNGDSKSRGPAHHHQPHNPADNAGHVFTPTAPNFGKSCSTARLSDQVKHRRTKRLCDLLRRAEEDELIQKQQQATRAKTCVGRWKNGFTLILTDSAWFEMTLDSVMAVAIMANSVFIALEIDHAPNSESVTIDGYFITSLIFSCLFWVEIVCKLRLHGFSGQFCGPGSFANIFDAFLIALDTLQLGMSIFGGDAAKTLAEEGVPSASLFRVIRLVRLVRIIRLLRTEKFKDLLGMIQGLAGGILTLGWSTILFFLIVFVWALVCRELLGTRQVDSVTEYFDSVPRALLTVFRCSFGDCSTHAGTPIFEFVTDSYGGAYGLIHCIFIFFVTIGLFNVISAIFVDATLAAASEQNTHKLRERLGDPLRWATCVKCLVATILEHVDSSVNGKLSDQMNDIVEIEVSRDIVNDIVHQHPHFCQALLSLDIDPDDHDKLSDILDADHSGTIEILELVNGLQRLRGPPKRSDIVCIDLMVRDLQEKVGEIGDAMKVVLQILVAHQDRQAKKQASAAPQPADLGNVRAVVAPTAPGP
jgi:hypothetical protein